MTSDLIPTIFEYQNPSGKKVWKIEAVIGHRNGKRIRTRRTAKSYAEAKRVRSELFALAAQGDLRLTSNTTLREFAYYWIDNVKAGRVKQSTLADYRARFDRHIGPFIGGERLNGIKPRDLEQWMGLLKRQGYSISTINGARRVLHGVFQHARREDLIGKNPVELTEPYKRLVGEKTQVQQAWSKDEVLRALRASRNTEFDLFLHMALLFGMRRGEMLALREKDMDIDAGLIHINGTLKEQRVYLPNGQAVTKLIRDTAKTEASNRSVGIPWPVLEAIMRHRQFNELKRLTAESWIETDSVFKAANGLPVYPTNFAKRFKSFLRANQLRPIRIHDLRHTMAELALGNNIRIEGVSETLGHTRIDTTKQIYAPKVLQLSIETPHQLAEALMSIESSFGLEPATKPKLDSNTDQEGEL